MVGCTVVVSGIFEILLQGGRQGILVGGMGGQVGSQVGGTDGS